VHFGLLSPPCTFPGIQIIWRSAYRFFALSSTAGYLLSGLRQPSHPARIFSGILPDPFYLLPARRLPAHVTLVKYSNHTKLKFLHLNSIHPSMYINRHALSTVHFFTMLYVHSFLFFCFFFIFIMPIRSPTVVSQHLSKSDKRDWLTRWPSRSFANPIWHSAPLCLH